MKINKISIEFNTRNSIPILFVSDKEAISLSGNGFFVTNDLDVAVERLEVSGRPTIYVME